MCTGGFKLLHHISAAQKNSTGGTRRKGRRGTGGYLFGLPALFLIGQAKNDRKWRTEAERGILFEIQLQYTLHQVSRPKMNEYNYICEEI